MESKKHTCNRKTHIIVCIASVLFLLIEYLKAAVREFTQAATKLWVEIENTVAKNLTSNHNIVRIINNKLLNLERAFIHPEGLPGRPYYK